MFSEFGARPRTFPEANFPKICHNFGTFTPSPIFPKICHNFGTFTLSPNFLKIWHNFGTFTPSLIFPNICRIFWTFPEYKLSEFLFCVSVILNLPHASVALLNSPWAHCRSVGLSVAFDTVSSECDARTEFPEPNFFPKICHSFGTFTNTNSVCTSSCVEVEHLLLFWKFSYAFPFFWIYRMRLPLEFKFIMRFETGISDFGGCSTTLLGAASTKTSCP